MHTKRTTLYWCLQLAGWGAYFTLCAALMFASNPNNIGFLAWLFILAGHLAVSHLVRYVIKRQHWLDQSPGQLALKLIGACLVAAFAVNLLIAPIPPLLGLNSLAAQFQMFRMFVPFSFFLFSVW